MQALAEGPEDICEGVTGPARIWGAVLHPQGRWKQKSLSLECATKPLQALTGVTPAGTGFSH